MKNNYSVFKKSLVIRGTLSANVRNSKPALFWILTGIQAPVKFLEKHYETWGIQNDLLL